MDPAVCNTAQPAPLRLLRQGCSGIAVLAALLLVGASALATFYATTGAGAASRAMQLLATSALLAACGWGLRDARRAQWPALFAGLVSFIVLAFSGGNQAGEALTPTMPSATGLLPMATLVAIAVVATQSSAKLARRSACNCG